MLAVAGFSFGLLFQSSLALQAQVAIADTAGPAKRIWTSVTQDQQEVWFRRTLEFSKPGKRPRLWFSCDDECTVFVNGQEVGTSRSHENLTVVQLEQPLSGKVTIAVNAKNECGPAALALWLLWDEADGQHEVATDEKWRVTTTEAEKWKEPGFDDTKWELAAPGDHSETTFGRSVYNGAPTALRIFNAITPVVDPIARAVEQLRSASDREAALKALDAVERAVMDGRAKLWRKPESAPSTR